MLEDYPTQYRLYSNHRDKAKIVPCDAGQTGFSSQSIDIFPARLLGAAGPGGGRITASLASSDYQSAPFCVNLRV